MAPDPDNPLELSDDSFDIAQDLVVDSPDIAAGYDELRDLWLDHAPDGHPSTPYVLAVDPVADGDALLAWVQRGLKAAPVDPGQAGLWFEFIVTDRVLLQVQQLYLNDPHPDNHDSLWDFGGWDAAAGNPDHGGCFPPAAYPAGYDSSRGTHSQTFDLAYAGLLAAHVGRRLDAALLKLDSPDALFYAGFHDGDAMLVGKLSQSAGWRPNTAREPVI